MNIDTYVQKTASAALALGFAIGLGACARPVAEVSTRAIAPYAECSWEYVNGLEPLKNSATTAGFDTRFNPSITVSRRGLTARVIGVLSDDTLSRFGGSLQRVVAAYPYLTPIRFTAVHHVAREDINQDAAYRIAHPRGEVIETQVIELPPNSVMILYPVSIAAHGMNTAAGNWSIIGKDRARPSGENGEDFAQFPFLRYTTQGHALHGPITGDRQQNLWTLLRGKVSHGCNRMEGEHIVELSVLLGCPAKAGARGCAPANEKVTVMEEFDHFPAPELTAVHTGIQSSYSEIAEGWITPELPAYPRDSSAPLPADLVAQPGWYVLDTTRNKAWTHEVPGIKKLMASRPGAGAVKARDFVVWDNRLTANTAHQFVKGIDCR